MSQLFISGGQNIGVSASTSVIPINTQDWSPLGWTGCISLQSNRLKSLLQYHSSKASILQCSAFFIVQLSHPDMTTGKNIVLTRWTFVDKAMFLLLTMLCMLVITFFTRSKRLLSSWLQSPSAMILEPHTIMSATVQFPHVRVMKWWTGCRDISFLKVELTQVFHSPLSLSSRGSLVLLHFLP